MRGSLHRAVEILFKGLPFSRRSEEFKEKIIESAGRRFDEARRSGMAETEAAGEILLHSGSIEKLCGYLQIEGEDPGGAAETAGVAVFVKGWKKLRRNAYFLALECTGVFGVLLSILLLFNWKSLMVGLAEGVFFIGLAALTWQRRKKYLAAGNFWETSYAEDCRRLAEKRYDLYSKKLINSVFFAFSLGFFLFYIVLLAFTTSKYSVQDVAHEISFYLLFIETAVYLLLKNLFCQRLAAGFFCRRRQLEYGAQLRRLSGFSVSYYGVWLALIFFLRNRAERVLLLAAGAIALYAVLGIFYNFTRRGRIVWRNLTVNGRKIICYMLVAVTFLAYHVMKMDLYLTQPYINTVSQVPHRQSDISYDEDTGIYTITAESEDFRILQLTDIHLGGSPLSVSKDIRALQACYRLISAASPDLVVVTGDLVFPMGIMSFSLSNSAPVMQFAAFMRNTGIPWAFTYGNHDTEAIATLSRGEVDALMKTLSYKSSGNLLYPYIQPDIYGRNNQMIEIRSADGALMQALFLMDSNDYVETGGINEYDYIHDDQVEWYRRTVDRLCALEGDTVPSMIFIHIPLREYKTANDLYESGSDEVTYYYGILGEKMNDKICCSQYESRLFDTAVKLGSTKAIFCGHDHYNNQSLEYQGIRLTYGYSIDYLAMPGIEKDVEQRGATLITIRKDGSFEITPCRLIDLEERD